MIDDRFTSFAVLVVSGQGLWSGLNRIRGFPQNLLNMPQTEHALPLLLVIIATVKMDSRTNRYCVPINMKTSICCGD